MPAATNPTSGDHATPTSVVLSALSLLIAASGTRVHASLPVERQNAGWDGPGPSGVVVPTMTRAPSPAAIALVSTTSSGELVRCGSSAWRAAVAPVREVHAEAATLDVPPVQVPPTM